MDKIYIFHGSSKEIKFPEIRKTQYTKDFSWGFYCTKDFEQASRWANRRNLNGVVNTYSYTENPKLKILTLEKMTDEWLDFIAKCRKGFVHDYDIVEGPMADDTIWNFVNDFFSGNISRETFWTAAKFKHPTNQISFHSIKALDCLEFYKSEEVK